MNKKLLFIVMISFSSIASAGLFNRITAFDTASAGNPSQLKALLDRGVNVNLEDRYGDSLLAYACLAHNIENAKLLVRRGADINQRNHKGESVIGSCSLAKYLKRKEPVVYYLRSLGAR